MERYRKGHLRVVSLRRQLYGDSDLCCRMSRIWKENPRSVLV